MNRLVVGTTTWLLLAAGVTLAADPAPTAARPSLESMLPGLHLLEPFWNGDTVYRESLIFVRDEEGQPAVGKLLFPAEKILAFHRADGALAFEAGRDYTFQPGEQTLKLTSDSRIPQLAAADLFPPAGSPNSIPQKTGDPTRSVLFDNGHWFHDQQVEVTYTHKPVKWPGKVPTLAAKELPKTLAKLRGKQKVTLAVSGDSISEGYNASGFSGASPWMPPYPDLVAAQLRASYGADVELKNRAVGGWNVVRGQGDLNALLATNPDLVIIAYGMNDVGGRNPAAYRASIADMLARIRQHNTDTEVILVATMLGNANWIHTPREMFAPYRDALASFVGPGVALADLTDAWQHLLEHKREIDVNGNGVNHPSDFGHRVYAQVILALLTEATRGREL
jgi:lysophospholipase L1-like esterase